jgi:hypothetical protein
MEEIRCEREWFSCGAVLLALTLTTAMPQFGQDAKVAPSDADHTKHSLAISILREINAVEVVHRMEHGSYSTGRQIVAGNLRKTWRSAPSKTTRRCMERGSLKARKFCRDGRCGWISPMAAKVTIYCLEDTTDKTCGYAAVTDERGVIRQSKTIDGPI